MPKLSDMPDTTAILYWVERARAWQEVTRQTPMIKHEAKAAWVKALELLLVRLG